MKKLMFAGIAALCATVAVADGTIESQNIVGYQTTTARSGYTLFVPAFDDVGVEGLDIQNIKPNINTTGVNIQTFTAQANGETMYYYVPAGKAGAGWYTRANGSASSYASKTFAKGEGFMAYFPASDDPITFNVAGEVSLTAKTLENVRSGYTLMGNFRPTSYSIQKIVPATDTTGVNLQTFTAQANGETMYYYVPAGKAGAGWYTRANGSASSYADKTFTAGEGFMIYLPSSMNVTFQAAE